VTDNYDAIVIGGGPAGSTAAAVLAEKGRRVLVLEREKFPRYHVGESLMPYCYFPLERLGVLDQLKASSYPRKMSVQFVGRSGRISQPFYFFQHFDHEASTTWQVVRSEFDHMLLNNARGRGAEVIEEANVKQTIEEDGYVRGVRAAMANGETKEFRAPVTVDASGRDAMTLTRKRWKERDAKLNKIAIWTYYRGALRDPGLDEGATTVAYIPEKGWFWYIPLPDNMVSVGVVAEKDYLFRDSRDPETIFQREIENNAWIKGHLAPGEQTGQYWTTGEYSYRSRHCAANGIVLTGDAFAFLDPVFSSGVFLALRSGEMAAAAVDTALANRDYSAAQFDNYSRELCEAMEVMRKLVYAFYDQEFSFRDLIMEYPHLRRDLTDCLIGNMSCDFKPLFEGISKFARLPEPLTHGRPLVES
jgi:flavin-dependent dehydrogenase